MNNYQFLAWVRAGAAASLSDLDDTRRPAPARGRLEVSVAVGGNSRANPITLYGPGDVLSLDQRQIVRVYPPPGTADAETTNFPLVEFDRADLPWMFTPLRGPDRGPLRPWLALVCLPARWKPRREAGRPLPVLRAPGDQLPDPLSLHLWAHSQVIAEHAEVAGFLGPGADPRRSISRLLASRLLRAFTDYVACVVPAFEAGRLAGLGDDEEGDLSPSWRNDEETELPVYFSWEFRTGEPGDFEILADRLRNWPLPADVGQRPMVVGNGAGRFTVQVESALRRTGTDGTRAGWPFDETSTRWRADLDRRLTPAPVGDDDPDPEVLPPRYGGFHRVRDRVGLAESGWFAELNLDPRWRVAAGLGTLAVQSDQERLMASAWRQLADIREANRFLNLGRFARLVGRSLHRRHLDPLSPEEAFEVSLPLQARVPRGALTLHGEVRDSGLPDGTASLAYHRATSPRGPLSRRVAASVAGAGDRFPFRQTVSALARTPAGLAAPYRQPDGAVTFRTAPDAILHGARLAAYWKALTPSGQPLLDWAGAQQQLADRANRRIVDAAALQNAPDLTDALLDDSLVLSTMAEIEAPESFFTESRLDESGNIRFPNGNTMPVSDVIPLAVDLDSLDGDQLLKLATTWRSLGQSLRQQGRLEESAAYAHRAVEAFLRLAGPDPAGYNASVVASLTELAGDRYTVGPIEEFIALAERVIAHFSAQAQLFPTDDKRHRDAAANAGQIMRWIAKALREHGRREEAVPHAQRAVETFLPLAELDPARHDVWLAASLGELAGDRNTIGPIEEFIALAERVIAHFSAQAQLFPTDDKRHRDAAANAGQIMRWIAKALREHGRREEAVPHAERAVETFLPLAGLDPATYDAFLIACLPELAGDRYVFGPVDGFIALSERAIAHFTGQAQRFPTTDKRHRDAAGNAGQAMRWAARALREHGRREEAVPYAERAVEIFLPLAGADPAKYDAFLVGSLTELTTDRYVIGPVDGYVASVDRAIAHFTSQAQRFPTTDKRHRDAAGNAGQAMRWAAKALREHGRPAEAVPYAERAVETFQPLTELDPDRFKQFLSAAQGELKSYRAAAGLPDDGR
ncbi:tetratricopeptide repeat protein [Catellatospora sichuanensis]|uniref:tetratricopeptide repeat protein n=1 Tax=Catellatospora sichuanensis TaxID=1969805 RepID=UPI0016429715|nr:tetratricopeptide repeat protein [Catellatospora sichuanensis]